MTERSLTHLRHVDIAVPDFEAQLAFYTNAWGLTQIERDGDLAFLAAEGSPEQYSVRIRQAPEKRLDLISFGAADRVDVDKLAERLGTSGVQLISEPDIVQGPGGGYGFRFFDADGRVVEVSADVASRQHRKIEAGEPIPVKLSHVVVNSPDIAATRAFYEEHLGFKLSDTLAHPDSGDLFYFMRINNTHHTIAFAQGPHTSINHMSFEMRGLDEYMRGTGRLLRSGTPALWGPGRHAIGDNTFSYFLDPHGNVVEYTTELLELDEDTWHPEVYDATDPMTSDQWGTAGPMSEQTFSEMRNDVDKGVFVAPPV
ncbi:VOC family protein [Rhodococcus sp. NCIMB 12038]|uniref:VOC family protein n=1 Tax=Rhodococcus sp. NCIMB 12038 TaxID=933800 RepID=UPI000B3CA2D5|nr:VOC family protein [Rhodococcus sp. NCIMB 12038]OUS84268.1 oxidoreductase [Rhodococcus sp. NCIMB 12038]